MAAGVCQSDSHVCCIIRQSETGTLDGRWAVIRNSAMPKFLCTLNSLPGIACYGRHCCIICTEFRFICQPGQIFAFLSATHSFHSQLGEAINSVRGMKILYTTSYTYKDTAINEESQTSLSTVMSLCLYFIHLYMNIPSWHCAMQNTSLQ